MKPRKKTRDCPVCGRGFVKGKRCYVPTHDGRLIRKLVCMTCAVKAERIIVKVSAELCMTPGCPHNARVCTHCAAGMVLHERENALAIVIHQLRGIVAAGKIARPPLNNADELAWYEGRLEGLQSALAMLLRSNAEKSKVQS
jgi:hypothetical protein